MSGRGSFLEPARSIRTAIWSGFGLIAIGVFAGFAVSHGTSSALAVGLLGVLGALVTANPACVERAAVLALLGGAMVLGYGFANLGVQAGVTPLPLTEILLLPLVSIALLDTNSRPPAPIAVPVALFLSVILIRLAVDYATYGRLAIRDATTGFEVLTLFVGYRALVRDGIAQWITRLRVILFLVLAYATLYPWAAELARLSPTVGLQRQVPLLGSFEGDGPAVAAAMLFFLTYSRGVRRVLLVGWALAIMAVFQSRGLYLVVPAALFILGWGLKRPFRVIMGTVASLALGIVLLSLLASAGIQGRVGPLSPSFFASSAATLLGKEGPAAGTLVDRKEWARETIAYVERSPRYVLFGVGLGPDLTFGFLKDSSTLVRKPHDDYLEIFARIGLVGLAIFLWLLISSLTPIVRVVRAGTHMEAQLCAWILATASVYLGIAATQPLLAFPYGSVPLFFLLGMGAATYRSVARQHIRD